MKRMRVMKRILISFIFAMVSAASFPIAASAKIPCDYCDMLIGAGFPASYAEPLCKLHFLYPKWQFEAVDISKLSLEKGYPEYSWDFCIEKECGEKESNALVLSGDIFAPYRKSGSAGKYDSGCFPASREAVSYFMDPRNFLNPCDIFQFLKLDDISFYSEECIENMIEPTFLSSLKSENYPSFASAICDAGKKYCINPIFLAARLRGEQGKNGNALARGDAGSTLFSLDPSKAKKDDYASLNGIYNLFNIKAGGNGKYAIFLSGAVFAKQNEWSSPEASLFGGAKFLADEYLSRYQNTLYFQKWNVDARSISSNGKSRNFSFQYMQNIGAALSDAKNIFSYMGSSFPLDMPMHFLIPVYSGMPEAPSPDPACGSTAAWAAQKYQREHIPFFDICDIEEEYVFANAENGAEKEALPPEGEENIKENAFDMQKFTKLFSIAALIFTFFTFICVKSKMRD